jgi:Protein of unknown function (DUF3592)
MEVAGNQRSSRGMKRRFELDLLIMILIPIFIGLGFAALTTWSAIQIQKREDTYVETVGTVTSLKTSPHFGDRSTAAYVTFTDQQGQTHTFLNKSRSTPSRHAVGQAVSVWYDPASTRSNLDASIDSFAESMLFLALGGVTAGAFLISGVTFLTLAWPRLTRPLRRRKRRAGPLLAD